MASCLRLLLLVLVDCSDHNPENELAGELDADDPCPNGIENI